MGNSFGPRLRHLRKTNGMTQEELANRLGISASSVGMYEQNRRMPDRTTLVNICNIFSVTADYLLGNEREPIIKNLEINNVINDFINALTNQQGLMFNGTPLTETDKKKLTDAIQLAALLSTRDLNKEDGD